MHEDIKAMFIGTSSLDAIWYQLDNNHNGYVTTLELQVALHTH
jgi:hypothetical protein